MTVSYHAGSLRSARASSLSPWIALLGAATGTALACGPPEEPRTPPAEPPPGPIEPSVPHALLDSAKQLPILLSAVETNEHFGERLIGELRLSPEAQQPYLEGQVLPNGTQIALLVRAPFAPTGTPADAPPLQILWMEKSEGRWQFAADRGDGQAFEAGDACARCHAEAAVDFVFRIQQRVPPGGQNDGGT